MITYRVQNVKVNRFMACRSQYIYSHHLCFAFSGKHWKRHKEACNLYLSLLKSDNATEPPLRRHLRHWTARFEGSLLCAAIVGMDIRHDFSNVHKYGMIVRLNPRPHAITGARFTLKKCDIVSMDAMRRFSAIFGMDTVLNQHEKERELMKKKSRGQKDFAACVVMVLNEGKWKLDGEHNTEVRFKPLCIIKDMARSPQLNDPSLAWLQTLEMQIQKDIPTRSLI